MAPVAAAIFPIFGVHAPLRLASFFYGVGLLLAYEFSSQLGLTASRAVRGLALGVVSAIIPVYTWELFCGIKLKVAISLYAFATALISALVWATGILASSFLHPNTVFRVFRIAEAVCSVILFIAPRMLPESPTALARNGKWLQATKIMESTCGEAVAASRMRQLLDLRNGKLKKESRRKTRLFLAFVSQFLVQLSSSSSRPGVLAAFWEMLELPQHLTTWAECIASANVACFLILAIVVLRFCRAKDCLFLGTVTSGVSDLALAYLLSRKSGSYTIGAIVLGLLFYKLSVYGGLLLAASWIYALLLPAYKQKCFGIGLASLGYWLASTLLGSLMLVMERRFHHNAHYMSGATSLLSAIAFAFMPDFASSLSPVPELFEDSKGANTSSTLSTKGPNLKSSFPPLRSSPDSGSSMIHSQFEARQIGALIEQRDEILHSKERIARPLSAIATSVSSDGRSSNPDGFPTEKALETTAMHTARSNFTKDYPESIKTNPRTIGSSSSRTPHDLWTNSPDGFTESA